MARTKLLTGAVQVTVLALAGVALGAMPQASADGWARCLDGPADRQATFQRAAEASGVPEEVLLGVSYMQTRWDDHGTAPSFDGGYGPMHLTEGAATTGAGEKGDPGSERVGTLPTAADLMGVAPSRLRTDAVANVCGGAAVLASFQPRTTSQAPSAWSTAVADYAGAVDEAGELQFARQVFDVIRTGESRTTNDGQQVTLAASPGASLDEPAAESASTWDPGLDKADCPRSLDCEVIEAPYEQTGPSPSQYANYDLADRENNLSIDYFVIHNTECEYETCIGLIKGEIQPGRFVSWQYTLRSEDGHVAQHVDNKNVAAHAGNWYINMHSIGFEHEGFAAQPGAWYTESMYRSSASLLRHLARKYDIKVDRAHVVGHDQYQATARWDPGPYWDWERYMKLVGSPIKGSGNKHKAEMVTVRPGFHDNPNHMIGCAEPGAPCPAFGSNFVYLRTAPSETAPLINNGTYVVSDKNPRAAAGHVLMVADRQGDWLKVWWDGTEAWLHNPKDDPTVVPSRGEYVTPAGDTPVTVYARAYPEQAAYAGTPVPYQGQPTLDNITLKPGQKYAVGDKHVPTDYYRATTYFNSGPGDGTVIRGEERFYQVWVGHRFGYVKADDVELEDTGDDDDDDDDSDDDSDD